MKKECIHARHTHVAAVNK
jgi:hypothetical protein